MSYAFADKRDAAEVRRRTTRQFRSIGRLRRGSFARRMVDFLSRVKVENLATLTRTWVDGAQVFATFHFPNRRNHAVFFNGLISNVFRILIARWCGISLSHKFNDAPVRLVERILA